MLGQHLITAKANLQSVTALSSMEAEFYALCKAAMMGLFLRALLQDWGYDGFALVVGTDSSSAKSFSEKRGLGKNRHIQTKFLWVQERIAHGDFTLRKLNTLYNLGDLMTKPLTTTVMAKHLGNMFVEFRSTKAKRQKNVLSS
jgi:hypothetical protein